MKKLNLLLLLVFVMLGSWTQAQTVSISDNEFFLDGQPFDMWGVRVASASQQASYTAQLIDNLDTYKSYGINTVTVFYQGSSGGNYDPFSANGQSFRDIGYRSRMDAIIEACAARDMVVIVGIFYQLKAQNAQANLKGWEESKAAVRTVVNHLKDKNYRNVILNIANEQNSPNYDNLNLPWRRVRNVNDLISLVNIAKAEWADLIVGCGGYDHDNNAAFAASDDVDVLLFDTIGPEDSEDLYKNRFLPAMGNKVKPAVNVEQFGGWTKRFTPPAGDYNQTSGRSEHNQEVDRAANNEGLYTFFHSNPWFQGLSVGAITRFDLGGGGTDADPGVKWYFEYVSSVRGLNGSVPIVSFAAPAIDQSFSVGDNVEIEVITQDSDGILRIDLYLDGELVDDENSAPWTWSSSDDPALNNLPAGTYTLVAKAFDNTGIIATAQTTLRITNQSSGPVISFEVPDPNVVYPTGTNLYVNINVTKSPQPIANMRLFIDNQFVRQENKAPWEWGASGQNDPLLQNLSSGQRTLRVIAVDITGSTITREVTITVGEDEPGEPTAPNNPNNNLLGIYRFKHVSSGKYMDSGSGNVVDIKSFNGEEDQQWKIVLVKEGQYNIDNQKSGRGVLQTQNNNVIQWISAEAARSDANSTWKIESISGNRYRFKNLVSGRGYLTVDGTQVVWNSENSGSLAVWELEQVDDTSARKIDDKKTSSSLAEGNMLLYPNPAQQHLYLGKCSSKASGEIIDIRGTIVRSFKGNQVDVSYLPSGLYQVRVWDQGKFMSSTLSVE